MRRRYFELVERPWFVRLLAWIFAAWALLSFLAVIELVLSLAVDWGGAMSGFRRDDIAHLPFINWASLASTTASAVLVVAGLLRLRRRRRVDAYRMFSYALLVAIFVTRVFAFVESQFGAVFGLAVDLLLLVTVRYMAEQEQGEKRVHELARAPDGVPSAATVRLAR